MEKISCLHHTPKAMPPLVPSPDADASVFRSICGDSMLPSVTAWHIVWYKCSENLLVIVFEMPHL